MAFRIPTLPELFERISVDFEGNLPAVRLPVSVERGIALVLAGITYGLHGHIKNAERNALPSTCDEEFLPYWADALGVPRRFGSPARGIVVSNATGFVDLAQPVVGADGREYVLEYQQSTVAVDPSQFIIRAAEVGFAGNTDPGTELTLSPAWGSHTTLTVSPLGLVGGFEPETVDQWRDRIAFAFANPDRGGSFADYKKWALEVPGVLRVNTTFDGAGESRVYFVDVDGRDGFSPLIPDFARTQVIRAHIATKLIGGVDFDVSSVSAAPTDVTLTIPTAYDSAERRVAVELALAGYFASLSPGEDVIVKQVDNAISSVPGLRDYTLTLPASNVSRLAGEIAVLGTVTFT